MNVLYVSSLSSNSAVMKNESTKDDQPIPNSLRADSIAPPSRKSFAASRMAGEVSINDHTLYAVVNMDSLENSEVPFKFVIKALEFAVNCITAAEISVGTESMVRVRGKGLDGR